MPRLKEKKIMREKIISILSELRPEFDFSEPVNFIEEGMLDSFDIVTLVDTLDTEYDIVIVVLTSFPKILTAWIVCEVTAEERGERM